MRNSRLIAALALLCGAGLANAAGPAEHLARAPARVVSMNLCTDLLAMRLAAPGQLVSVSELAQDPQISVLASRARSLAVNSGRAEEIYLLRPDLVLASTFSNRATVGMLRRLNVPVVEFPPVQSLDDVADQLIQMGEALGQESAGRVAAESYKADLEALPTDRTTAPVGALWFANGFTGTSRSLSGQILTAAGFTNLAETLALPASGILPLERLILGAPDIVITGRPHRGHSHGEDLLTHPAISALGAPRTQTTPDWVCGGPEVLEAVADLAALWPKGGAAP